jgi:hypothetical protein
MSRLAFGAGSGVVAGRVVGWGFSSLLTCCDGNLTKLSVRNIYDGKLKQIDYAWSLTTDILIMAEERKQLQALSDEYEKLQTGTCTSEISPDNTQTI